MRTEAIFEIRRQMPELSDRASFLYAFLLFRAEGTKYEDENGKYIMLTGKNDPMEQLGYSEWKFKEAKRELTKHGLIKSVRIGFGKGCRVYVSPFGRNYIRMENHPDENTSGCDTTSHSVGIPPIIQEESHPNASYIRKTNRKTNRKDQARTASQPSRAPTTGEILQQMLEEELAKEAEAKRKEKKNDKSGGFTADDLPTEIL